MGFKVDKAGNYDGCVGARVRVEESRVEHVTAHGAIKTDVQKEVEVEMVGEGGTPNIISVADVFEAGACNVLLCGRVVEEVEGEIPEVEDPPEPAVPIETFDVGVSGEDVSTDRFGTIDVAAGTTFGPADMTDNIQPSQYTQAAALTFTANDLVPFEGGKVRVAIFYSVLTPPTH
jgi:hypothetical protein